MKKVEFKTPEELKILTDKTRTETVAFLKKLKKKKPKDLDDFVHGLHVDAFQSLAVWTVPIVVKPLVRD